MDLLEKHRELTEDNDKFMPKEEDDENAEFYKIFKLKDAS